MKQRKLVFFFICLLSISCKDTKQNSFVIANHDFPVFSLEAANQLLDLPLQCITQEYPNKLGQVLAADKDLLPPRVLRPAFYGCFDWHSAVHAHWSLVVLLKQFPDLQHAEEIKNQLEKHLSRKNISQEIAFFETKENASFERTYGWAWLFQLATELNSWEDELAEELLFNLIPLVQLLEAKMLEFLPKLKYPIRSGEHPNTAFALSMAYDFALAFERKNLKELIIQRTKVFYAKDENCPILWEPSGYDFLSPCLEEAGLMSKVLSQKEFKSWVTLFLPDLVNADFNLPVGVVSDRTDGKLVHLDGLNFSRAWNLYRIQHKLPELNHLKNLADAHFIYSYPNLLGDAYEGGHWLGSFALYALQERNALKKQWSFSE